MKIRTHKCNSPTLLIFISCLVNGNLYAKDTPVNYLQVSEIINYPRNSINLGHVPRNPNNAPGAPIAEKYIQADLPPNTPEAQILEIDSENKRISLGLKQLMPNPWDDLAAKFSWITSWSPIPTVTTLQERCVYMKPQVLNWLGCPRQTWQGMTRVFCQRDNGGVGISSIAVNIRLS